MERHAVRGANGDGGRERDQAAAPDISAGEYRLRAEVPNGIFSLAVEADEATARAEHAAFADRCMPLLAPVQGEPGRIRSALLERKWQGSVVMRSHASCHCGWRSAVGGMYQRRRPVLREVCALTEALWKMSYRGDAGKHAADTAVTPGDLGPRLRRTRGSSDTGANAGWQETNERKAAKGLSGPMLDLRESGSLRWWLADDLPRL